MKHLIPYWLIRLAFAVLILFVGARLFWLVLPLWAAYAIAIMLASVEFFGPMLGGQHGAGLRLFIGLTAPFVVWPLVALAMVLVSHDHWINLAIGGSGAALTGLLAARHGQGHEHARLAELFVAAAIPFVALIECLVSGDRGAAALACVAVAAGFMAARGGQVWPDRIEKMMASCAVFAVCLAVATAVPIVL